MRRQCGDIDLWVSGERKGVLKWLRTQCEIGNAVWHHVDAFFYDDVDVEVHFKPSFVYNPLHLRRLLKYFDDEKERQMKVREEGFNYPTTSFNAVFALTHIFHHLLEEGVGVRHIIDYYYIVKNLKKEEHPDVLHVINQIGLTKFLRVMMYVLKEMCGMSSEYLLCELDEREGKFVLEEVLASGNFGKNRKGNVLRHNSIKRFCVMAKHYPMEASWMIPWKAYQLGWRMVNGK